RQMLVESIERPLQPLDVRVARELMSRNAELATEIEEIVLHLAQHFRDLGRNAGDREHDADRTVQLVDGAVGLYAQAVLRHARAVAEAGRAVVAGACVDLAESMAHRCSAYSAAVPTRVRRA